MAAYSASVSLLHILDLIKNHPSPPISFDKQQLHSLTENAIFMQEFLEGYVSPFSNSDEADPLEIRIADAAYAAEDVIELYIVENIHLAAAAAAESEEEEEDDENSDNNDDDEDEDEDRDSHDDDGGEVLESYIVDSIQLAAAAAQDEDELIRCSNFYQGLQEAIDAMDLIKKEVTEMETVVEKAVLLEVEPEKNASTDAGFKSISDERKSEMVGFDDVRLDLLERLTRGDPTRQVIPIVGMGGIDKTTLALNVFADQLIKELFDVCLWATISLDHNIGQTIRQVLSQCEGHSSGEKSVAELGEELYRYLFDKRYLVVLDDMWSVEAWDKMRFFFPDCSQRSRVMVTTRMSNLASHLTNPNDSLCMSFLNEVDSWSLFSKAVFGDKESFPAPQLELREIGEKIVGKCKGLPLSIAVVGGLLAKSERTRGYWEYIEENLSSIVNLEDEEYCMRVLKLSYNHLPTHLKPCFLYMGVFDEDSEIKASTLIPLWVSEGFLKPKKGKKSLETVAREYLKELVDRNLVLVVDELKSSSYVPESDRVLGWVGINDVKLCRMHDLVRDVCLREAQRQRFFHVCSKHNPSSHCHGHRRIVIPSKSSALNGERLTFESWPNSRSYVCHDHNVWQFPNFKLLRTLHTNVKAVSGGQANSQEQVFGLVNLRLLVIALDLDTWFCFPISRLWSLHTLIVHSNDELDGPDEFWSMHQLKHVEFTKRRLRISPPDDDDNIVILENLHTLIGMEDFHLNEDVVTRIPNLRILDVAYGRPGLNREVHCLSYLQRLSKLESFRCSIVYDSGEDLPRIRFPQSLKQILVTEHDSYLQVEWGDLLLKIGELPFVEELGIQGGFFGGGEWETTQGQFPRLKTLRLACSGSLVKWTVPEASHFPLLENLILRKLKDLKQIPLEIGEIATLQSIEVHFCSRSAVLSAKKIVEEQEEFYGEDEPSFRVLVADDYDVAVASLASPNFHLRLRKLRRPTRQRPGTSSEGVRGGRRPTPKKN